MSPAWRENRRRRRRSSRAARTSPPHRVPSGLPKQVRPSGRRAACRWADVPSISARLAPPCAPQRRARPCRPRRDGRSRPAPSGRRRAGSRPPAACCSIGTGRRSAGRRPCCRQASKVRLAAARQHKARRHAKRAGTTRSSRAHFHRCRRPGPPRDCIKSVRKMTASSPVRRQARDLGGEEAVQGRDPPDGALPASPRDPCRDSCRLSSCAPAGSAAP